MIASLDRLNWEVAHRGSKARRARAYMGWPLSGWASPMKRPVNALDREVCTTVSVTAIALNIQLSQMLVYQQPQCEASTLVAALANPQEEDGVWGSARAPHRVDRSRHAVLDVPQGGDFRAALASGFLRDMRLILWPPVLRKGKSQSRAGSETREEDGLQNLLSGTRCREGMDGQDLTRGQGGLKKRNYNRGRELFGAVVATTATGSIRRVARWADLTGVGARFSLRDLLESVVDPNKRSAIIRRHCGHQERRGRRHRPRGEPEQ